MLVGESTARPGNAPMNCNQLPAGSKTVTSNNDLTEERVRLLAELVGIPIDDAELPEVANRFSSLMQELDRLRDLDLEGIEPVAIFPDTDGDA